LANFGQKLKLQLVAANMPRFRIFVGWLSLCSESTAEPQREG
jgi:hypothetical protein